jgi:hypothetical protein
MPGNLDRGWFVEPPAQQFGVNTATMGSWQATALESINEALQSRNEPSQR